MAMRSSSPTNIFGVKYDFEGDAIDTLRSARRDVAAHEFNFADFATKIEHLQSIAAEAAAELYRCKIIVAHAMPELGAKFDKVMFATSAMRSALVTAQVENEKRMHLLKSCSLVLKQNYVAEMELNATKVLANARNSPTSIIENF